MKLIGQEEMCRRKNFPSCIVGPKFFDMIVVYCKAHAKMLIYPSLYAAVVLVNE